MTKPVSSATSPARKIPSGAKKKPASLPPPKASSSGVFLADPVAVDQIADENREIRRRSRLVAIVNVQTIIIAVLSGLLFFSIPLFQPIYQYYALNPEAQVMPLVSLNLPNMTNQAVLSWATVGITEVMTMGFGDFESHLKAQKFRFTADGWESFAKAFDQQKIGEAFRQNQLVLTTVPSDTPVIVSQGVNDKNIYQWNVQMPVIMTYATNNNVTRRDRTIIDLIIRRVPLEASPDGVGIQTWRMTSGL